MEAGKITGSVDKIECLLRIAVGESIGTFRSHFRQGLASAEGGLFDSTVGLFHGTSMSISSTVPSHAAKSVAGQPQTISVKTSHSAQWMGLAVLATLLISGCQPATAQPTAGPPAPSVRVLPLVMADVVDYEYFTGRTDATETVEVKARVTGYLMKIG